MSVPLPNRYMHMRALFGRAIFMPPESGWYPWMMGLTIVLAGPKAHDVPDAGGIRRFRASTPPKCKDWCLMESCDQPLPATFCSNPARRSALVVLSGSIEVLRPGTEVDA